jgi:hypothetical protein
MKLTKEIVLSLFLLAAVVVVPYILTKVFRTAPAPRIEPFQARNPVAVNKLIRGIASGGDIVVPTQKQAATEAAASAEVMGVFETSEQFQDVGAPANGSAPTSVQAPMGANLSIPTPPESAVPPPQRGSLDRAPMMNPYVPTPDNESVATALQPEITAPVGNMTVSSFVSGPAPFS